MLTLSDDQMTALAQTSDAAFERRVEAHLRRHFPAEVQALGDLPLRAMMKRGVYRGRAWGIVAEREVCKLLGLMVAVGEDFDRRHDGVAWVLVDPGLSPASRLDRVYDIVLAASAPVAAGAAPPPNRTAP